MGFKRRERGRLSKNELGIYEKMQECSRCELQNIYKQSFIETNPS